MESSWKAFGAHPISHSTAHYLMTIRDLLEARGYARVTDVARELGVSRSAVSVQAHHLAERGLVGIDERRFLTLTEQGSRIAQEVLNKRRTLKLFLTSVLGVPEELAELDACKVEHLLSREASNRILAFLHYLDSDEGTGKQLLRGFRAHEPSCPRSEDCGLCHAECWWTPAAAEPGRSAASRRPALTLKAGKRTR